ncbi:MAG TPA: HEPN domain-containing protein [Polyangiaceae bacterium]|nr:HEPN domain-containing protein [Polyangiaceae bacterium]
MTNENRRRNLQIELERGAQALEAARLLLKAGIFPDAASRAYYATLHAARALLLSENEEPTTHGGVQRLIGRDFVRSGRMPPAVARALSASEKLRLDADYASEIVITQEDAAEALRAAEEFTAVALTLLREGNWLSQ